MPDGSLRIKTRLDNSGLDKDTQVLENKIKKLQTEISKNTLEQKGLEKEINDYEQLTINAKKYEKELEKINSEKTKMQNSLEMLNSQDVHSNKEYKLKNGSLHAVDITTGLDQYQTANKLSELNNQAERVRIKYQGITSELQKQASKIDNVHVKLDKVKAKQEENNSKMREYKQKIEEAKRKQLELNYSTEGIGKSINSGITKILKYGMALLSINSIYGLLTNAMNSWLSGNNGVAKQLKADIDYMKNAIGRALSPVLKYIVNLLYQALGLAGALIKAFTGIDIFAGSVADYMSSTTSSANKTNKELKKQLTSFDKINKLNDDSSSNSSGGSGGVVAPSQDLSQIMNKYTEFAEKVKKVFDEIKDLIPIIGAGILAWKLSDLFFNQLGGLQKLGMKMALTLSIIGFWLFYDGIKKLLKGEINLPNILGAIGGGTLGIAMLLKMVKGGKMFSLGKSLRIGFGMSLIITGLILLYNGISRILKGDLSLESILTALGGGAMTTFGIASLLRMIKGGQMFSWGKALKIGFGMSLSIAGIMAEYNSVKKMLSGDITLATILQATGSAFLAGLGIWMTTGSMPAGLIATAGVLAFNIGIEIGVAIRNFINGTEEVDVKASELTDTIEQLNSELGNNREAYENAIKSIDDTCEAQIVEADYAEKLAKELDGLVDANGKVVSGNEARVDFILKELSGALDIELSRNGDLITKNGEVVNSYSDLQNSISKTIEAKKKEAEQTAIMEKYKESIKEQIQAEKDLQKAKEVAAKAYEEWMNLVKRYGDASKIPLTENTKQIAKNMEDTEKALQQTQNAYKETSENSSYWLQQMTDNIVEDTGIITNEIISKSQLSSDKLKEMTQNNCDTWEKNYNKLDQTSKTAMLAQSTTIDKWSPVIEQKWRDMANNSSQDFLAGISQVDTKTQEKILSTVTATNNLTPELKQAWANLALKSRDEYNTAISKLEPETRNEIQNIVNAIDAKQNEVNTSFSNLATGGLNAFGTYAAYRGAGVNVISGIVKGINDNKTAVINTIKGVANGALSAFNVALGIHSPSRVMADQAKFIPLGIAEGVDSTSDKAVESMKNLVYGMQETVDDMDYSNITQIPKIPKNAVTYVPKQAISTNEVQRSIVGQNNEELNRLLSILQSGSKGSTTITVPIMVDGEEWFTKTIKLNEVYNLETNGGGL